MEIGTRPGITKWRAWLGSWSGKSRLHGDIRLALSRGNFISTQTALVRKACLEDNGGFDERLARLQDWDLWLRLSTGCHVEFVNQPLVNIYPSPDSISRDWLAMCSAFEIILEKNRADWLVYRELKAQQYFAHGELHLYQGSVGQARRRFFQALKLAPDNIVYWLASLASMTGGKTCRDLIRRIGYSYFV